MAMLPFAVPVLKKYVDALAVSVADRTNKESFAAFTSILRYSNLGSS